jgi:hypothetical protein
MSVRPRSWLQRSSAHRGSTDDPGPRQRRATFRDQIRPAGVGARVVLHRRRTCRLSEIARRHDRSAPRALQPRTGSSFLSHVRIVRFASRSRTRPRASACRAAFSLHSTDLRVHYFVGPAHFAITDDKYFPPETCRTSSTLTERQAFSLVRRPLNAIHQLPAPDPNGSLQHCTPGCVWNPCTTESVLFLYTDVAGCRECVGTRLVGARSGASRLVLCGGYHSALPAPDADDWLGGESSRLGSRIPDADSIASSPH